MGHWGTTPGLNFCYAHLNRVIKARSLDMVYVMGPGHGVPTREDVQIAREVVGG